MDERKRDMLEGVRNAIGGVPLESLIADFGHGPECDLSKVCGCEMAREHKSTRWCEAHCGRYGGCDDVALASDIEVLALDAPC